MKKVFTIISSIILGIGIGAIGTNIIQQRTTNEVSYTKTINQSSSSAVESLANINYPKIKISQNSASQRFHRLYSQAKITSITLKVDHNDYVYEIEGFDNKKSCTIQVNATNGEILGQSTIVAELADDEQYPLNLSKTISRKEATKIAEKQFTGSTAREWHLYYDSNKEKTLWNIKLADQQETHNITIDAITKQIISPEN